MAIAQGDFDTLFGKLNTALENYAAALSANSFEVKPDYYRNPSANTTGAFVFTYFNGLNGGQKAGSVGYMQFNADYFIDLLVFAKATRAVGETEAERADVAAGSRLRYLIAQVMDAIWKNSNVAELRRLKPPTITPLPPERMNQIGERVYAAARMSFSAPSEFTPTELEGTDLEAISITADLWSAYIEPDTREE